MEISNILQAFFLASLQLVNDATTTFQLSEFQMYVETFTTTNTITGGESVGGRLEAAAHNTASPTVAHTQ